MEEKYRNLIDKLGSERVKLNETLSSWTTFRLGGPADLFYDAKKADEIINSVNLCRQLDIPYFILGGGSNVLVTDKGFRGLVIKISNDDVQVNGKTILAGAGCSFNEVVEKAAENSLSGLEFAIGIPGSLGGAIVGNAGAWRQSIGDRVSKVRLLNAEGEDIWIDNKNCLFSYRYSDFKRNNKIILEAELKLESGEKAKIETVMKENLKKRVSQPKEPSAGCVFVNPKPLVAGEIIDQCGLKGMAFGGALISPKHANFIVNAQKAKTSDVFALIKLIKERVKEKFNIDLKEEIKVIGEL